MTIGETASPGPPARGRLSPLGYAFGVGALAMGLAAAALLIPWGGESLRVGRDGATELAFTGCDAKGRCADFSLFTPGYAFRWNFGKDSLQAVEGPAPRLRDALAPHLQEARLIIAAGLASNEGDEGVNRRLAACRSKRLAHLIDDAQFDLRSGAPVYRLTLGRYAPEPGPLLEDSAIERLLLVGFMRRADREMNLDQALKDGIERALPGALPQLPGPIARQLDLSRYSCWRDEFAVTPDQGPRTACFAEPALSAEAFCGDF